MRHGSAKKHHRGVYTLIIRLPRPCRITIGKHLPLVAKQGLYLYVGSALGRGSTSLEARIARHLRQQKNRFWHIDRILACKSAQAVSVVFAETARKAECKVNAALLMVRNIAVFFKRIGSSDCRCESHFLKARGSLSSVQQNVTWCYLRLGLRPKIMRCRTADESKRTRISQHMLRRQGTANRK
jgi:Uri superfamily endonuclease